MITSMSKAIESLNGFPPLTTSQLSILHHTEHRAAGGYYCGGGPDMDTLVAMGLMKFAGRKSFVPDDYFTITPAGRSAINGGTQ